MDDTRACSSSRSRPEALTCIDAWLQEFSRTDDQFELARIPDWPYGSPTSCAYTDVISPQVVVRGTQVLPKRSTPLSSTGPAEGSFRPMYCPFCRNEDSRVVDSRTADDGAAIKRRRQCPECGRRFTTVETAALQVLKRSGVLEPFSREKVVAGVRKACQARPVTDDELAKLAQDVEDAVRAPGSPEVPAHEVGMAILGPLRELDEVAYLRFASVYRSFESLEDFEAEVALLRAEREPTGHEPHTQHSATQHASSKSSPPTS